MAKRATSNLPVNYEEQLKNEIATITSRIATPGGDRIRMINSSHFILPDGTETELIEGVIVDWMSANLFFDSPFDRENPNAPACFAVGVEPSLLAPSNNVPNKQADTCVVCPNNQFGSAGKGKACKNTRLLAIKPLNGEAEELYILSVPPTSIKPFDSFVSGLVAKHRIPPVGVLTRVSLDKKETYAAPRFEVVRPLSQDELPQMMESRTAARERLSAEPDFTQYTPPSAMKGKGAPAGRGARR